LGGLGWFGLNVLTTAAPATPTLLVLTLLTMMYGLQHRGTCPLPLLILLHAGSKEARVEDGVVGAGRTEDVGHSSMSSELIKLTIEVVSDSLVFTPLGYR
jgi:hypothetical protein